MVATMAAAISFICSVLIVFSQRWHGSLSQDHDLSGIQKFHTTVVPRAGGFAVVAGIVLGLLSYVVLFPGAIKASGQSQILFCCAPASPPSPAASSKT